MRIDTAARDARALFLPVALFVLVAGLGFAQEQEEEAEQHVRVLNAHTNVHKGPTTVRVVLVLAPKDTVFPVVGRQGEWYEVRLSPELRETGMVMRWYEDEETGWVHQSQVELVDEPGS